MTDGARLGLAQAQIDIERAPCTYDRLERLKQHATQRLGRLAQHPLACEQTLGPAPQTASRTLIGG